MSEVRRDELGPGRIRFAGNPPILAPLAAVGGGMLIAGAGVLGLLWALRPFAEAWVEVAAKSAFGVALVGLLALAVALCGFVIPLRAFPVLTGRKIDPEVRSLAVQIARHWRGISSRVFPPVTTVARDQVFPGLDHVTCKNGQIGLCLRLPNQVPAGGRIEYVKKAASELPAVLPIHEAEFVKMLPGRRKTSSNYAVVAITPSDISAEVRKVAA